MPESAYRLGDMQLNAISGLALNCQNNISLPEAVDGSVNSEEGQPLVGDTETSGRF